MKSSTLLFKKVLGLFFTLLYSNTGLTSPPFLGRTINQTTINDLKSQYKAKKLGRNIYSNGQMYEIEKGQISYKGNKAS